MNTKEETPNKDSPSSSELRLPEQLSEDLTLEAAVGVKTLQYLATVAEDETKRDTGDAFSFPSMMMTTPSTSGIKDSLFFAQGQSSKSTVASVSLKSWSREDLDVAMTSEMQSGNSEVSGDSVVFRPPRIPFVQRKSKSDPTVSRPVSTTESILATKSVPDSTATLHGKFFNAKLRKKFQTRNIETRQTRSKSPVKTSRFLKKRHQSSPDNSGIFSWLSEESASPMGSPRGESGQASVRPPTNNVVYTTPSAHTAHVQTQPGIVRRFVPFLRMSKRPPLVSFPRPEIGLGFGLESAMYIVVKSFNGYWKATNGAKELCKAQESLPQWKKLHHRMDGPMRFLFLDCTRSHFRLASWTAVIQHQEQRPWNGQAVTFIGSKRDSVEFHMTVELKGMSIEAKTTWNDQTRGSLVETYSLSPDRNTITFTVKIDLRSAPPATRSSGTSMVHSVLFHRV